MGTVCSVKLYETKSEKIQEEIFERLRQIDDEFNVNKSSSDVSRINFSAGKTAVTTCSDVIFVLKEGLDIFDKTDGRFNPMMGRLIKLWGIGSENERIPGKSEISQVLKASDIWKNPASAVEIDEIKKTVFVKDEGIQLDFGAIAKGFAADEIAKICKKNKVKRAVIDLGGNIYAFGKKNGKNNGVKWNIGIKNPEKPDSAPAMSVLIDEGSVVTSGVYERFFVSDGKRYHHILDSSTGFPVQGELLSVTVISKNSMRADAFATGFFALGKEKSAKFLEKINDSIDDENEKISAIFITDERKIYISGPVAEFPDRFCVLNKDFSAFKF